MDDLVDKYMNDKSRSTKLVESFSRVAYSAAEGLLRVSLSGVMSLVKVSLLNNKELLSSYVKQKKPVLGAIFAYIYCSNGDLSMRKKMESLIISSISVARSVIGARPELIDKLDGGWLMRRFDEMGVSEDVG